ncbi:MAG: TRAP transporter substrate-binding protein [Pseudomonadota bacterium]
MRRRHFLTGAGAGLVAAGVAACGQKTECTSGGAAKAAEEFRWKMVTTWPPNLPGLGSGATNLAKRIETASGGRLKIRVYAAGELVPAFEVFNAVSQGTAEIGHGAAYYWKAKVEAAQLMTTVPFGLNAAEMDAWMYYGGGLELWRELYAPFNLVPFPAGNTGAQMGGWFNREVNAVTDLKDLKMRIPGMGGEALRRAGGLPVNLPGGELFTALQTGNIDATEWVGPYNDVTFGFPRIARYYYYPGWHEPGPTLEAMVNQEAWNALPEDLQEIVRVCCQSVNCDMLAEYTWRNAEALETLAENPDVEIRRFPDEVLTTLRGHMQWVMDELVARDEKARKIYESLDAFRTRSARYQEITEAAFLDTRQL